MRQPELGLQRNHRSFLLREGASSKGGGCQRATCSEVLPSSLEMWQGFSSLQPSCLTPLCTGGLQDRSSRSELIIAGDSSPAASSSSPLGTVCPSSESPPPQFCKLPSVRTKGLEVCIPLGPLVFRKAHFHLVLGVRTPACLTGSDANWEFNLEQVRIFAYFFLTCNCY